MTIEKANALKNRWDAIYTGAGSALDWVQSVRQTAPRLDREADNILLGLYRARNQARSLARVATTPMTLGFFGVSQAGKSYLISALAAGEDGKLVTRYGNHDIDFIEHVNPVGGGAEATGLVTRFSRSAKAGPDAFPVELKLFAEVDLAKILVNAYFNDFDAQQVTYEITDARIHELLDTSSTITANDLTGGITAEDVVSLYDYGRDNFGASLRKLEVEYWPKAIKLAPYLTITERASLFSVLWGEQQELTRVYTELAQALQRLGNASAVYAPLESLVKLNNGHADVSDSIVNVNMLQRMGTPSDPLLQVCPIDEQGSSKAPVTLTAAQLATLTAELTFPLANAAHNAHVEKVDILDFPGYRSREKSQTLAELADPKRAAGRVSQLLLRGKVAYLFERYTDQQEMNGLVFCTPEGKQNEVPDVIPVVDRWVRKTQGESPTERSRRTPGLMWAITMMDKRIDTGLTKPENQMPEMWDSFFKLTMTEFFNKFEWFQAWDKHRAFCNTYLVRKPAMNHSFLDVSEGNENRIRPEVANRIVGLRTTFCANPEAIKHTADPANAWDQMMALNDGGMRCLSDHIGKIANLEFKLQRIEEQLETVLEKAFEHSLKPLLQKGGVEALTQKQAIADTLKKELIKSFRTLPDFFHYAQVPEDLLRDIYLNTESMVQTEAEERGHENSAQLPEGASTLADDPFAIDDDPFSGGANTATPGARLPPLPEIKGLDHHFARLAYKVWVGHLRTLPSRTQLPFVKQIGEKALSLIVDEIITAASRLNLEGCLGKELTRRDQSGTRREQIVARQVLACRLVLGDFLLTLGALDLPLEKRPRHLTTNAPVFENAADIPAGQLPEIEDKPRDCTRAFGADWISTIYASTLENAGHLAGSEINVEQNVRLETILNSVYTH